MADMISLKEELLSGIVGCEIAKEKILDDTNGAKVCSMEKKSNETGEYYEVRGVIYPIDPTAPNIEWKILLPLKWNRRSVQVGGGANNGIIPDLEHKMILSDYVPIDHGYVVFGDDSGHQAEDPMDADFAANEEALQNYIRRHLIKMNSVMHVVVEACYGEDAEYTYFVGGSAGGREALECATTYGKYYDGVFCASPASNFVILRIWGALLAKAVYDSYDEENYPYSDGFIDEETVAAIRNDAVAAYDELDGIKDGIVSNIFAARANHERFLKQIQEKYKLSDAQLETIRVYEDGFKLDYSLKDGVNTYVGCSALEGGLMDLGPDPVPREPLDTLYNVHHGDRADGVFKYFITKDHSWKLIKHDYYQPEEELLKMLKKSSEQYDVAGPDFDEFIAHGGKLIFYTNWGDMSISPWQSVEQYKRYVNKYGQEALDEFMRFYCMPAGGHISGITMNYLEWLDHWCTTGYYPEEQLYGVMTQTGAQMPMAKYPGWVRYKGGDPLIGTSYEVCYEGTEE